MKVVLAYSGGLDTSAAVAWLKQEKGAWVHAVLVDVGQQEDFEALRLRAYQLGADQVTIADKKTELVEKGILPMLQLGATYEKDYLLGTAIARPFIADALVEAALESGASAVCHGATGKGNDYLRFEQRIKILAPGLSIISPWREWKCGGREDALKWVESAGVQIAKKSFDYSIDANLWHSSYEGGCLEQLDLPLPDFFQNAMTKLGPLECSLTFENGLPTQLNGSAMAPLALIQKLNEGVKQTGFGWLDLIETRTNGLKSRGIYHTPAGSLLTFARTALNQCWFPKPTLDVLDQMGQKVGTLLYQGIWQHPIQLAYEAAVKSLYQNTSGTIQIKIVGAQPFIQSRVATPNLFSDKLGGFSHMQEWPSHFSEALVFFQHLQHHSQPPVAQSLGVSL